MRRRLKYGARSPFQGNSSGLTGQCRLTCKGTVKSLHTHSRFAVCSIGRVSHLEMRGTTPEQALLSLEGDFRACSRPSSFFSWRLQFATSALAPSSILHIVTLWCAS